MMTIKPHLQRRLLPLLLLPLSTLANSETLPYYCDDGSRINISFSATNDGRPQATLHLTAGDLTLPQVPAASGALYRSGENRLHTKGENSLIEDSQGNRRQCHVGSPPPLKIAPPSPALSSFLDISGSVSYRQRSALPPEAVLIIRVQNLTPTGAPARQLAEQRIELAGRQVPILFSTTIDRDLIGKKSHITVAARIEHRGKPLFVSDKNYPALINDQPQAVEINLRPASRGIKP